MTFEQWQETRKYVDDLNKEVGAELENVTGGFVYAVGYIEEDGGTGYCVDVFNEGLATTDLEEAEKFLWEKFAKDEV